MHTSVPTCEVNADEVVPTGHRVRGVQARRGQTRVIDQHVQLLTPARHVLHVPPQRLHILLAPYIHPHKAVGAGGRRGRVVGGLLRVHVAANDPIAFGQQRAHDAAADAVRPCGAGNNGRAHGVVRDRGVGVSGNLCGRSGRAVGSVAGRCGLSSSNRQKYTYCMSTISCCNSAGLCSRA